MNTATVSRGLPNNPRPRAKSAAAPPSRRPPVQDYALPHNRTGSSIAPRRRVQDTPSYPISSRQNNHSNKRAHMNDPSGTSESSPTSSVSSASSIWAGGNLTSASSRTTLPSDEEEAHSQGQKPYLRSDYAQEHKSETNDAGGFTWNKVTEVANVFTQEVTKVWASGLNPLGLNSAHSDANQEEDSHLTRVMRAYHLSKAQTPSELPGWLFSERERGQVGGLLRSEAHHDDTQNLSSGPHRNHIGTKQTTNTRNPQARLQNSPMPTGGTPPIAKASGADRLKMLRDSRRNAPTHRI